MDALEEVRNRVLRRADWRFLLSTPAPDTSAVYADGPLLEAVQAVSRRVLDGQLEAPPGSCDLAVAADPDGITLRRAWSALRAGGSCYTEWTRRALAAPAVIRRRLAAAGFADVAFYAPRPSLAEGLPQVWIPLGSAAAATWYLAQGAGRRGAVATATRRIGLQLASWLPLVTPVCAVARKAGHIDPNLDGGLAPRDFQAALHRAFESWQRAAGTGRALARTQQPWVLLTRGVRSVNKAVLVALDPQGRAQFVVKLPRTAEAAAGIAREAVALDRVRATVGDVPGIPRVVFSGALAGVPAVGETAVHGVPLSRLVRRTDVRVLAMLAVDWQARLIHQSAPRGRAAWWERIAAPALAYLNGVLRPVADPTLIRATETALATLDSLPLACEQRDFSPWNVLQMPDGGLGVLDWESAEPMGLPALDLIYFLTYLAIYRNRASSSAHALQVHLSTIDMTTAPGRLTGECLARYSALAQLDPAAIVPLRILCWLLHAASEHQRGALDSNTPAVRPLERSLFVAFWRQELEMALRAAA